MMQLCFSTFAREHQKALQGDNSDIEVVRLLLGWIADKPGVLDRKGEPLDITPPTVSDLLRQKSEIPKALKNACTSIKIWDEALAFCKSDVLSNLNPYVSADMYENIIKLVENDDSISREKRNELLLLYNQQDRSEFFTAVLLYVISRTNKKASETLGSDDIPLLAETNYTCPLCHKPLVENIRSNPVKLYEIVSIFPDDLKGQDFEFLGIKEPDRKNTPENKIALCKNHAVEYLISPMRSDYLTLKELKTKMSALYSARIDIYDAVLEGEIKQVLNGLKSIKADTSLIDLPMDALRVDQKIKPENHLLKTDVMSSVLKYYNYVHDLFSLMEREDAVEFDLIASEVRTAYKKLDKGLLSQDEIVDRLAEWIQAKTCGDDLRSCRVVVAFFIQNCEVFNAIA